MTFHSKAAMNDIYNIFNHSKKEEPKDNSQTDDETDYGDDTYSTGGESVVTGRISGDNSEFGDDTTRSFGAENTMSQPGSVSPWSDFTASKHMPKTAKSAKSKHKHSQSEDMTENFTLSQNQTMQDGGFDTMAIAALADQDFGDLDTKMIAQLAGDIGEEEGEEVEDETSHEADRPGEDDENAGSAPPKHQNMGTPVEECFLESEQAEVQDKPRFVPIPPEDYEPTPLRPYRDPAVAAQSKLPFMTPIVERTESSMAPSTIFQNPDYFTATTPSRSDADGRKYNSPSKLQVENLLLSSPAAESPSPSRKRRSVEPEKSQQGGEVSPSKKLNSESPIRDIEKIPFSVSKAVVTSTKTDTSVCPNEDVLSAQTIAKKSVERSKPIHKGPIILDLQCNPCDQIVRQQILDTVYPSISTYKGFVNSSDQAFGYNSILKTYAAKQKKDAAKSSPKKQNDKMVTKSVPPVLKFNGTSRVYAIRKELGKGAYAPVYLVDSYDAAKPSGEAGSPDDKDNANTPLGASRGAYEAIKSESPPLTLTWEFHILHLARSRLGDASRAMSSIIKAQECHLYRDECYLVLEYHEQGTLLDLVNLVGADNARAGKTADGLDESVAMWLSVELLRSMDELWRVGLLHGDLKIDNCLVRFDLEADLTTPYHRDGSNGWTSKGLTLIDFGRGIDTRAFKPDAKFVADWRAEETDCAEIREARPWKYEIDLFGAAGVIHSLLFGKYIETVTAGGGGLGQRKEWKLRENLKRYWERDIWTEVFGLLINGGKLGNVEEVRRETSRIRILMEDWLEKEGERGGRDLRGAIRKCERLVKSR